MPPLFELPLSPSSEVVALRPSRVFREELVLYSATTFPKDPYAGRELYGYPDYGVESH